MQYLLLVILLNTFIFTAFKLFAKYNVDALQAITVNYWVCMFTGWATHGYQPFRADIQYEDWLLNALLLGGYFIFLFNLMAYTTAQQGMTVTSIANKLSLVIPVVFAYWLYGDSIGWLKIAGILLAIPAVYMATAKQGKIEVKNFWLPALVFICSGLSDTYIKYIQHYQLDTQATQSAFTITMFTVAAIAGSIMVAGKMLHDKDREKLRLKNIVAGILLGIPNYFSIYYLIRLFDADLLPSSSIIPVNNIGIVVSTALVAILFFKEAAGKKRVAGIILAIISIILIALSGY